MTNEPSSRRLVRFGVFEVDLDAGELRRRGTLIRLPLQAFQVLQALIEHPGRVVSREELQRALWPADTFVEFDRGLNNAISRVRDVLDDSATHPRFIETIPRRGYRFIASVDAVAQDGELPPIVPAIAPLNDASPEPALTTSHKRERPWLPWTVAAAMALTTAVLVFSAYRPAHRSVPALAIKSVAVLPLRFMGAAGDASQDYLADGMTDSLVTELSKLSALQVISETSSRRFRETKKSLPDIARELNVDAVIEGSVFREGNVIRVNVQLIDARTDGHLWAETYTRGLGNVMTLHSDVALDILREIGTKITPQERVRISKVRSVNTEAHRLYVLGNRLRLRETEPELYAAMDYFQRAIAIEPQFAQAYWGMAESWISLGGFAAYLPPREGMPKARAAAMKALEIDNSLAQAHAALAYITEVFDWDFHAAEQRYQRALDLSPNDATTHKRYSLFLQRTRRPKEGLLHAQRAYDLDPLSIDNNISVGMRLVQSGKTEEGLAAMRRAGDLDPTYFETWVHLGEALVGLGRGDEAIEVAKRGVELSHGVAHAVHQLANIHGRLGRRAEALALMAPFEQPGARRNPFDIAFFHFTLKNYEKAVTWLITACDERNPQMAFFHLMQTNKLYDPLRQDPRYPALMACATPGTASTK